MTPEDSKKEKVLAVVFVFFLFFAVGSLLFYISYNNKEKNTERANKALLVRKNKELTQELNKVSLLISTSTPFSTSTSTKIFGKSFLTLVFTDNGKTKIINQKLPNLVLPIASITKLMDAVVIIENVDLNTKLKATKDYIGLEESAFVLETDKTYTVKDLLANALISSDNDSARLLSSTLEQANFISKMNSKAQELDMTNTKYFNVTGLDPKKIELGVNVSTASDLSKLLIYIKNKHPEILDLTANTSYNFCDVNNYCKVVVATNKLLENKDFKYRIIGGKTGTTDLALKNLVLIIEILPSVYTINVVLGSEDNFADTLSLINQIKIEN